MYLLDTNVVSELRKPKPHGAVVQWMQGVPEPELHISAVTIGEIQAGIEITREQDEPKAKSKAKKPPKPKMIQPKRSSLPRGWEPASMDLVRALKLLNLPRLIGDHPETKTPITAALGRFGPYITHNKVNANVPRGKEPIDVTVEEAIQLLAERIAKGGTSGGKGRFGKTKAAAKPKAASVAGAVSKAKKPAAKKAPAKKKVAPKREAAE